MRLKVSGGSRRSVTRVVSAMLVKTNHYAIQEVATAENFRGRGYGPKLLGHAEQLAKARTTVP